MWRSGGLQSLLHVEVNVTKTKNSSKNAV